jgi:hypothetical protein
METRAADEGDAAAVTALWTEAYAKTGRKVARRFTPCRSTSRSRRRPTSQSSSTMAGR